MGRKVHCLQTNEETAVLTATSHYNKKQDVPTKMPVVREDEPFDDGVIVDDRDAQTVHDIDSAVEETELKQMYQSSGQNLCESVRHSNDQTINEDSNGDNEDLGELRTKEKQDVPTKMPVVREDEPFDDGVTDDDRDVQTERDINNPIRTWGEILHENGDINDLELSSMLEAGVLPDKKDIQTAFELHRNGRLSTDMFDSLCNAINERIKSTSDRISSVKASYTARTPEQVCFVAMADEDVAIAPDIKYNIRVCHPQGYSREGTDITYHDIRESHPVTPEESEKVTRTIQANADDLFRRHSNIQMISGCTVKSSGFGTESATPVRQLCIVLYVNTKGFIPMHETRLPSDLLDPETKRMLPIDVREGGMHFLCNPSPTEFHQNLKMGCAITSESNQGSGTLGPIVIKELNISSSSRSSASKRACCITAAHVFFDEPDIKYRQFIETTKHQLVYKNESDGHDVLVYQGSGEPFGVIREAAFLPGDGKIAGIDAVLIEITDKSRFPNEGTFPKGNMDAAGFSEENPMCFNTGLAYDQVSFRNQTAKDKEVVMYGSESGYNKGSLDWIGIFVKPTEFNAKHKEVGMLMRNQLAVKSIGKGNTFAKRGDSGALVFARHGGNWQDLRAVGIIEGITENEMVVVTPIWDILDYFKINSGLVPFNGPTPMDVDMGYCSQNRTSRYTDAEGGTIEQELSQDFARQIHELKDEMKSNHQQFEERQNAKFDNFEESIVRKVKEQTNNCMQQQKMEHVQALSEVKQQNDTMLAMLREMMQNK